MVESSKSEDHGFISTDEEGLCTYANHTAARLLRRPPAELPGRSLWELLTETLGGTTSERWRQAMGEKCHKTLGELEAENGRRYSCRSIPSAGGMSICFLDVSEQQRIVEMMKEEHRRMDKSLEVLAHELRNPLSGLSHGLAVLRKNPAAADRERVADSLERQLDHLVHIVDNLMDVSNAARGRVKLHKEPVTIGELVAFAVKSNEDLFEQKGHAVKISVPSGTSVNGDVTRLRQVLINLLRNAAFYTDPGGTIAVVAEQRDRIVEIRIRDTGRGIAPETLEYLLEQYYGHRDECSGETGLGIGLGVVCKMVQLHGGTVTASSEGPGLGTEFVVRLPVSVRHGSGSASGEDAHAHARRRPLPAMSSGHGHPTDG